MPAVKWPAHRLLNIQLGIVIRNCLNVCKTRLGGFCAMYVYVDVIKETGMRAFYFPRVLGTRARSERHNEIAN